MLNKGGTTLRAAISGSGEMRAFWTIILKEFLFTRGKEVIGLRLLLGSALPMPAVLWTSAYPWGTKKPNQHQEVLLGNTSQKDGNPAVLSKQ